MKKVRIVRILVSILIIVMCFVIRVPLNGKSSSIWSVLYEGIWKGHGSGAMGLSVILAFWGVCGFIRLVLVLRNKRLRVFYYFPAAMFWSLIPFVAVVLPLESPESYAVIPLGYCIVGALEFLFVRYQENRDEIEIAYREIEAKEKEEKAHRKRAMYFPGKYPPELYQIMRRLFVSRIRSQILIGVSEIFVAGCLYIVFSLYGIMRSIYSEQSLLAGTGLDQLFMNLGVILMILGLVMMVLMISWYISEQRKDFRPIVVMGIRRKTAYLIFLLEFWSVAVLSGILGTALGSIAASLLRNRLQAGAPEGMHFPPVVRGIYFLISVMAYVGLMILALMLNQEKFISLGTSVNRNEDVQKERRAKKKLIPLLILGILFGGLAIAWYSLREWAESIYIHILSVIGILLILISLMGIWLRTREKRASYYRGIAKTNLFYHRFWSNVERIFFLAVVQFLALGVFAVQEAGTWMPQKIEEMYPYDIVVTAYEADLPELETIADQYQAEVVQYPMVRMTSIYGSDKLASWAGNRPVQWPQGQHIAVSCSSYNQMREKAGKEEKDLKLTGKEMHVVYQQDLSMKAHTIDWDTYRMEKHLRFGQPLQNYNTGDFRKIFPERDIKSEERDSLIGSFHQGMQDNLIVLPDVYFEKVYDRIRNYNREHWEERQQSKWQEWRMYTYFHTENMTEGPTMLFCMNLSPGNVSAAAQDLEYLKKEHEFDKMWDRTIQPFYVKSQMIVNTESEIFFTRLSYGFILLILLILGIFQYFVKMKTEEDTWKWENTFLARIGMKEKDRMKKIRYQLRFFFFVPVSFGLAGGILFAGLTAKARLYTGVETIQFVECLAVIYATWILLWYVAYRGIRWSIWQEMEKETQRQV